MISVILSEWLTSDQYSGNLPSVPGKMIWAMHAVASKLPYAI